MTFKIGAINIRGNMFEEFAGTLATCVCVCVCVYIYIYMLVIN
jgi:hypothetical protein